MCAPAASLTKSSAGQAGQCDPQAPRMAERSKTSSGAFYLWGAAARSSEAGFPRARAGAALVSEIGLAACKALEFEGASLNRG